MADETIVISVKDEVAKTPAQKFREMAYEALEAHYAIDELKKSLNSLPTTSVGKLSAALNSIANATAKVVAAETKAAVSADRNAISQQKLQTEIARTEAAEARAATAKNNLTVATERNSKANAEAAQKENDNKARMMALANAAVAEVKARNELANSVRLSTEARTYETTGMAKQVAFTDKQIQAAQEATKAARDRMAATVKGASADAGAVKQIEQMSVSLDGLAKKSKLTRNQILTLQYTASDIVASLGSGISPMTIALQQGPQVAQVFTREISALASRIGFMGAAAGAAATVVLGLAFAYSAAKDAAAKFNNTLGVTGNYAGLTEDSYKAMADQIAESTNKSTSSAREIVSALAASGRFQRQEIEQNATSILRLAKLTGTSADDITSSFTQMADSPTAFAESLNKTYHFLDAAQLSQIRNLEEVGKKTEATEVVSKALYDYLSKVDDHTLGPLSAGWNYVSRAISNATLSLQDFVYESINGASPAKRMAEIQQQFKDIAANQKNNPNAPSDELRIIALNKEYATLALQNKEREDGAKKASEQLKIQQELDAVGTRISKEWLKTVDNVGLANRKIQEFRDDIKKGLGANKDSQTYKDAIAAQKQQADIEKKIREQYQPKTKEDDKTAETRALAIAKINGELDKQVNGLGVLRPQRELQQKLDQYEIDLASRKIKLSDAEREAIKSKLQTIQDYNAAQQETDRIYDETEGPLKQYNATITAANALLKSGTITQQQHAEQVTKASNSYQDTLDPLREYNRQLDQQDELLRMAQPQREVMQQLQQQENTLRAQGKSLYDAETGALTENGAALQKRLILQQQSTMAQQAYDAIYAQTKGAQDQVTASVVATSAAYTNGLISMDVYGAKMSALKVQAAQLRIESGNILPGDMELAAFGKILDGYKGLLSGLSNSFGDLFVNITDGFANAIAGAIMGTESLGDALRNVAQQAVQQLLASLIKLGIQYAVNAAIGSTLGAAGAAESIALGGTTAAAWAPAAAAVSLATLGTNGIPAAAAITSANTLSMGFALAGFSEGGYTGTGGKYDVAGLVHRGEVVWSQDDVSRAGGVSNVEAMRQGRGNAVQAGSAAVSVGSGSSSAGAQVKLTVINNADNSEVKTSQQEDQNGNVDYIVTIDNIEKTLAGRVSSGRGPLHGATKRAFNLTPSPTGG